MFSAFVNCFKIPDLRQRIILTLSLLVIVRLGAAIPVPGINADVLGEYFRTVVNTQTQGSIFGMFNLFSGGAFRNCAIFSLTIMPYISASIIMQLATGVIPSLGKLAREEGGRQKITQFTRLGTLFLCLVQGSFLALAFLNPTDLFPDIAQVTAVMGPLVVISPALFVFTTVTTLTAGTMLLMWLGEQITDRGIGNGISLVITVGIVSELPAALVAGWQVFNPPAGSATQGISPVIIVLLLAFLFAVVAGAVAITQALRKVPVQYARQVRGNKVYGGQSSYLPLKVNYAGVMPIIFASMIFVFIGTTATFVFRNSEMSTRFVSAINDGFLYYMIYGGLVFFFSYFWVAMVFNPTQIADDMKRNGGFVPGVRPGEPTARFVDHAMTRLTFAGAAFLTILAILPMIVSRILQVPMITSQFFGGTGLLIIVGVMLDTMRQMETHLLQRHYDGFLKRGKIRGRSATAGKTAGVAAVGEDRLVWLIALVAVILIGGIVAGLIQA
ncbi:MAG: preprotein translocase subunit SecY [Candidatus Methylacidiphilales bacterium]